MACNVSNMKKVQVSLVNKLGMHARPSAKVAQTATQFTAQVWMSRKGRRVNAKSIMGVMMLAAPLGAELELEADGVDEDQAIAALSQLFASGFGEELG
jgi:phosphocarrier protein HPr